MDIDRDKALAALAQLESEKARRLQEKVDSGEAVLWSGAPIVVSLCDEEDARASLPTTTSDGRPIYYNGDVVTAVVTPIPRKPEYSTVQTASPEEGLTRPSDGVEAASGPSISCSRPTYIFVTTRAATSADPGVIAEAWFIVEDGAVVLRDADDKHFGGRALLKDEDPATVARSLLREQEAPKDFQRQIHYQKLGLA
jgi:hypothetical protein